MYEKLKIIAKKIIPSKFFQHNEKLLRNIISYVYKGNQYQCNICQFNLRTFVDSARTKQLCPNCGSLPRNRRLWSLIQPVIADKEVLHFSPPSALRNVISESGSCMSYITTDYAGEFQSDEKYDITNITCENDQYDIILCYHVLEHINEDMAAIKELYRILKPEGKVYIQTPFAHELKEDYSIVSKEDRREQFGQEDHVRIYSVNALVKRLQSVGFIVEIMNFDKEENPYNGFKTPEIILIGKKS